MLRLRFAALYVWVCLENGYNACETMPECTAQSTAINEKSGGVRGEGAWYVAKSLASGTSDPSEEANSSSLCMHFS